VFPQLQRGRRRAVTRVPALLGLQRGALSCPDGALAGRPLAIHDSRSALEYGP